jgi:hypothetical protein
MDVYEHEQKRVSVDGGEKNFAGKINVCFRVCIMRYLYKYATLNVTIPTTYEVHKFGVKSHAKFVEKSFSRH